MIPERGVRRSWDMALNRFALSLSFSMVSLTMALSSVIWILSRANEMLSIIEWRRFFFVSSTVELTETETVITANRLSLPFTGKASPSFVSMYSSF